MADNGLGAVVALVLVALALKRPVEEEPEHEALPMPRPPPAPYVPPVTPRGEEFPPYAPPEEPPYVPPYVPPEEEQPPPAPEGIGGWMEEWQRPSAPEEPEGRYVPPPEPTAPAPDYEKYLPPPGTVPTSYAALIESIANSMTVAELNEALWQAGRQYAARNITDDQYGWIVDSYNRRYAYMVPAPEPPAPPEAETSQVQVAPKLPLEELPIYIPASVRVNRQPGIGEYFWSYEEISGIYSRPLPYEEIAAIAEGRVVWVDEAPLAETDPYTDEGVYPSWGPAGE